MPGRHPFEVAVLSVLILYGIKGLLSGSLRQVSSASTELLGPYWSLLWHTTLVVAAGTALAGVFLAEPLSLLVERIGMRMLVIIFGSYGVGVLVAGHLPFLLISTIFLGLTGMALFRARQLTRDIRQWPLTEDMRRAQDEIIRTIQVVRASQ